MTSSHARLVQAARVARPRLYPRSSIFVKKNDSSTGAVHMGGPPGNARAPGRTRLPLKVEHAGRSLGPIQSCQTLRAEHEHLKYSKPINSVFYSSCRPWVDRQDLASARWGWSGPSIGRAPPTTRKTHMAFIQTDRKSAYVHLDPKSTGRKKVSTPRVWGASAPALALASCPGTGPRGRMVQVGYANL